MGVIMIGMVHILATSLNQATGSGGERKKGVNEAGCFGGSPAGSSGICLYGASRHRWASDVAD